jgi:hypothetical protein
MSNKTGPRGGCWMVIVPILTILLILIMSGCRATNALAQVNSLPSAATPGATYPGITQKNIAKTICNYGNWSTQSIRPPQSYTDSLKKKQIVQFGYIDTKMADYEEDHLIALTIGGNPRDPRNLWPQPWNGVWNAHVKDRLEVKLNKLVCTGKLTLQQAQKAIATNWIATYQQYVSSKPRALGQVVQ